MSDYTFIKRPDKTNEFDIASVSVEFNTISLSEILSEFESFLRASGFIINGSIEVVEKDG